MRSMVVLIMFSTLVLSSVLLVIAGSVNNSYGQIEAPLEATAAAVDGGISVQEALNMMAIASKAVSEHVEADGCHELCLERVGSTPMGIAICNQQCSDASGRKKSAQACQCDCRSCRFLDTLSLFHFQILFFFQPVDIKSLMALQLVCK